MIIKTSLFLGLTLLFSTSSLIAGDSHTTPPRAHQEAQPRYPYSEEHWAKRAKDLEQENARLNVRVFQLEQELEAMHTLRNVEAARMEKLNESIKALILQKGLQPHTS